MSTSFFPSATNLYAASHHSSAVLEMGSGDKTVVFLHGLFGTPSHWATIMAAMAERYRVIALPLPIDRQPDRRSKGAKTIGDLTTHVEEAIDSLRVKDFVLCGNSLGGLISIDYSLRHPDRVQGLVLAGSAGLYERSLTNGVKPKATREFVRSVIMDIFHNEEVITDELVDEWYEALQDRDYARFILRMSRATRDRCVERELHRLTMPTLILWGSNDEITPPDVAQQFQSLIKGAQLTFIDNCGHSPNLEQPKVFASLLESFLPNCFGDRCGSARHGSAAPRTPK